MSKKRYFKSKFKLTLRRWGLLCKKSKPKRKRLYVSKTILADGTEIQYSQPPLKEEALQYRNMQSINSEVHVWVEWKKRYNENCKFDTVTMSCVCGKTIEQFAKTKVCKDVV